jgi:catechol 2,3-dioxygenase-like lactoylglutathione lyase family enzyme
MGVQLNHTLVSTHDREASARFLAEMLGLADPYAYGPFICVDLDNGASLDFMEVDDERIHRQHYAFLVTDEAFDDLLGRIEARELTHWADPHKQQPGAINHEDGGRGVYWEDPSGHLLEAITVPYGGWK